MTDTFFFCFAFIFGNTVGPPTEAVAPFVTSFRGPRRTRALGARPFHASARYAIHDDDDDGASNYESVPTP